MTCIPVPAQACPRCSIAPISGVVVPLCPCWLHHVVLPSPNCQVLYCSKPTAVGGPLRKGPGPFLFSGQNARQVRQSSRCGLLSGQVAGPASCTSQASLQLHGGIAAAPQGSDSVLSWPHTIWQHSNAQQEACNGKVHGVHQDDRLSPAMTA